jgi:hypothetical protein
MGTTADRVVAELRRAGYPELIDLNHLTFNLLPRADLPGAPTVEDVERHVSDGSVLTWLRDEHGVAMVPIDPDLMVDYLQRAMNVESYGVHGNGFLRLLAHLIEAWQQIVGYYREALD